MLDVKSLDGGLVTRKFCFRVKTLTTATAVVGGGAIALGVSYLADGDRFSERIFLALLVSLLGVSLLGVSLYFLDQVRKGQNKQLALHMEHIRRLLVFNSLRAEASRLIFQSVTAKAQPVAMQIFGDSISIGVVGPNRAATFQDPSIASAAKSISVK